MKASAAHAKSAEVCCRDQDQTVPFLYDDHSFAEIQARAQVQEVAESQEDAKELPKSQEDEDFKAQLHLLSLPTMKLGDWDCEGPAEDPDLEVLLDKEMGCEQPSQLAASQLEKGDWPQSKVPKEPEIVEVPSRDDSAEFHQGYNSGFPSPSPICTPCKLTEVETSPATSKPEPAAPAPSGWSPATVVELLAAMSQHGKTLEDAIHLFGEKKGDSSFDLGRLFEEIDEKKGEERKMKPNERDEEKNNGEDMAAKANKNQKKKEEEKPKNDDQDEKPQEVIPSDEELPLVSRLDQFKLKKENKPKAKAKAKAKSKGRGKCKAKAKAIPKRKARASPKRKAVKKDDPEEENQEEEDEEEDHHEEEEEEECEDEGHGEKSAPPEPKRKVRKPRAKKEIPEKKVEDALKRKRGQKAEANKKAPDNDDAPRKEVKKPRRDQRAEVKEGSMSESEGAGKPKSPQASEPAQKKRRESSSFARRSCPKTSPAKDRWAAIQATFKTHIGPKLVDMGQSINRWEDRVHIFCGS